MEKAGRNDPCPCGSGKKFKKCCESVKAPSRFHLQDEKNQGGRISNIAMPLFKRDVKVLSSAEDSLEETKKNKDF